MVDAYYYLLFYNSFYFLFYIFVCVTLVSKYVAKEKNIITDAASGQTLDPIRSLHLFFTAITTVPISRQVVKIEYP